MSGYQDDPTLIGPQWPERKDEQYFATTVPFLQGGEELTATAVVARDADALGVDVSQYQQVIKWPQIKAGGVKFAFIRASYGSEVQGHGGAVDPYCAAHVQGAYDADIPAALYHAIDPGYYVYKLQSLTKLQQIDTYLPVAKDEQIQTFLKAAQYKKYYAIAVDFELYRDWYGETITEAWLLEIIFQFMVRVKKLFPTVPLYLYSGSWFINAYCKSLETTGKLKNICSVWTAYYPQAAGVVSVAWENIKSIYPPADMTINGRVTQNPPYLGFDDWAIWQFTGDKYVVPGITDKQGNPSAMDFNLANMTVEKLYAAWAFVPRGTTPEPPPVPEPEPTTDVEARVKALEDQVVLMQGTVGALLAWAKAMPRLP